MADPRKVPFVTLASFNTGPAPDSKKRRREDEENEPSSGVTGGSLFGAGKTEKDSAESKPTVRLTLSLSEPSEQKSAEFNYTELIHTNVQGRKVPEGLTPAVDPRDPLANQDREKQEVEALARKFESKYGNNGKKKRRDRMQDLIDIGYGYDETDPFIDNSEAYDELVPASLNTKLGGFYINTGTLQFRAASDSEDGAHNTHHKKDAEDRVIKRRKKKQDGGLDEKKPKKFKVPRPGVMALNRPDKKKRKKLMKDSLSLAAMIRRFTREKEIRKKNSLVTGKVVRVQPNPSAPTGDLSVADLTSDPALMSLLGGGSENDVLQELMGDLDFGMLDSPQLHSPGPSENGVPAALKTGLPGRVTKTGVVPQPPLPSGLPPPLLKRIEDLRVASRQFDMEGRKKFFTLDMNNILLDIELQVREQGAGVRAAVYSHLEAFVPCNRDALLKRLRKLSLHVQDERLQTPLLKLKLAVCAVMPEQIARYNMGCMTKVKLQAEEGDRNGSEDDDEEKPGRRVTGPRKKFAWDDKTRDLLCELVREKLGCYALEGQGSLSPEDYLKVFMETEVKVLWPKGWMQTRILIKESRTAHNHLTGNTVKKRIIPAPKPKPRPQDNAVNATPPPAPGVPRAPSPPEPICLSDSLDEDLTAPSLDSISEALALLSSAAKGLVPSGTPPPSEKAPGPQHASPLLAKKPASALSPSPSIKAFTTLPPPQRHTLVPAQRPAVTLVNKMGVPTPPPPSKPRPPATASPLHVPQKVLAVKTAAPGLIGGVVSSSQPRPLPSASLSMKPAQSFLAIGTSQAKVQVPKPGFITPMQATLTKSPHSSPILKLTPTALSPTPRTLPSMHQNSSKSPKFHSGFQGSGAFLPKASTQGNGKQPSISTPTTSANHGQRHRQVGVASALPQAAGPPLPLNFGMLGGLVPVSLPFQFPNMLNLPPSVSTATASCSTNPSSSGFTLPPSVLKSLMSGAHLQMPFSDVSQSQGGDLKRNSL